MIRRNFLQRCGWGFLAALSAPAVLARKAAPQPAADFPVLPPFEGDGGEAFWDAIRRSYPIAEMGGYFNTGGLGPASRPVLDLAEKVTRIHQQKSDTGHEAFEAARAAMTKSFGAAEREICFTRNTSEGNSIVAAGLKLRAGDEVILDSHAHPGGSFPWYNQVRQRGVIVKLFDPTPESAQENLARIAAQITPRTRVIQISHITSPTGILLPAAEVGKLAQSRGIWFHIDGAQSAGMFPFQLPELNCDSYATSGHKWLGGPHETGWLYLRSARSDEVAPTGIGAYSAELPFLPGTLKYVPGALRHEYGTRNAGAVTALAAAATWQDKIGRDRIAAHGRRLALRVRRGLEPIAGVEILTPSREGEYGSILTFRSQKIHFSDLFGQLWSKYHLRCRPVSEQGLNAVRVSTHVFNTPAECDRLIGAVGELSALQPTTP